MIIAELDFSNYPYLWGILIPILGVGYKLYTYAKGKGLKIVSAEKITAFKSKYQGLDELGHHISYDELAGIVKKAMEIKKNGASPESVYSLGKLIIDALVSDESKEPEK